MLTINIINHRKLYRVTFHTNIDIYKYHHIDHQNNNFIFIDHRFCSPSGRHQRSLFGLAPDRRRAEKPLSESPGHHDTQRKTGPIRLTSIDINRYQSISIDINRYRCSIHINIDISMDIHEYQQKTHHPKLSMFSFGSNGSTESSHRSLLSQGQVAKAPGD